MTGRHRVTTRRALDLATILAAIAAAATNPLGSYADRMNTRAESQTPAITRKDTHTMTAIPVEGSPTALIPATGYTIVFSSTDFETWQPRVIAWAVVTTWKGKNDDNPNVIRYNTDIEPVFIDNAGQPSTMTQWQARRRSPVVWRIETD